MSWAGPVPGIPDAMIVEDNGVPWDIPGGEIAGLYAKARPGALLQIVPGIARYLATGGDRICVAQEPDAAADSVGVFLHGAVRAALIHQRGELPLHAATLVPPDGEGAVAICGPSGMGKSTAAAALCARGWRLVADDLTRIALDGARIVAWPGRGRLCLWRDAVERLGYEARTLHPVRQGLEKFELPVRACTEPAPLRAIVVLCLEDAPDAATGAAKLALLSDNTFRPRQIGPLGALPDHLKIVARVASGADVLRLGGARRESPAALADRIERLAR
ncbi:MAG: hypothetical protein WDN08_14060 [Rhizomicrobium sp.]